ncbi:hypothetical protein WKW47_00800 [Staphylococcus nepalensis]|uniref:hypothetical protein n=1 Tax=Staphylococcus nepalensis TaxID=214473 RepID=UPI003A55BF2D
MGTLIFLLVIAIIVIIYLLVKQKFAKDFQIQKVKDTEKKELWILSITHIK